MKGLILSVAAMLATSIVVVNAEGQAHKGHASGSQLSGSVHVVFSTNEAVRREIRASFLRFLKDAKALADGPAAEDVFQMNFDLFSLSSC